MDPEEMEAKEHKIQEMQQYLPFLEDMIEKMKRVRMRSAYPDPGKQKKLDRLQGLHSFISNEERMQA